MWVTLCLALACAASVIEAQAVASSSAPSAATFPFVVERQWDHSEGTCQPFTLRAFSTPRSPDTASETRFHGHLFTLTIPPPPTSPAVLELSCPSTSPSPSPATTTTTTTLSWKHNGDFDDDWEPAHAPSSVWSGKIVQVLTPAAAAEVSMSSHASNGNGNGNGNSNGGVVADKSLMNTLVPWLSMFDGMTAEMEDQLSILVVDDPAFAHARRSRARSFPSLCQCTVTLTPSNGSPYTVPLKRLPSRTLQSFDFPNLRAAQIRQRASVPIGTHRPVDPHDAHASSTASYNVNGNVNGSSSGNSNGNRTAARNKPLAYDDPDFAAFITENVKLGLHVSQAETGKRLPVTPTDKAMETGFSLFRAKRKNDLRKIISRETPSSSSSSASSSLSSPLTGQGYASTGYEPEHSSFLSVSESITKQNRRSSSSSSSADDELVMLETRAMTYAKSRHSFALSTGFIIAAILEGLCPNAIQKAARKTEDVFENYIIPMQVDLLGGHHDEGGSPEDEEGGGDEGGDDGGGDEGFIQLEESTTPHNNITITAANTNTNSNTNTNTNLATINTTLTSSSSALPTMFLETSTQSQSQAIVAVGVGEEEVDGRMELAVGPGLIAVTMSQNLMHILPAIIREMGQEAAIAAATDLHPYLVDRCRDEASRAIAQGLGLQLAYFLSVSVNEVVTDAVHRMLPPYLLRSLTTILTHTVTRSVTHTLTGTLLHSLSTSPQHEGACYRCHNYGQMCEICYAGDETRTRMYVKSYYSQFFASYYSDYYSNYYVNNGPWDTEGGFTNDGSRAKKPYAAEISEFAGEAPPEEPHPPPPETAPTPWPSREMQGEPSEAPQAAVRD